MTRFAVRTLTLNPSIDVSSDTERVRPTHKLRTTNERMDPGGGGINVARVLQRFGVEVEATFLAGGATGQALSDLLSRQGVARRPIPIADDTRVSLTVHETCSGQEFRFVPEGPTVATEEAAAALDTICDGQCDYYIASGSLPAGVPEDVYATILGRMDCTGARFVLDTSGEELRRAVEAGGIFLLKPSREELGHLAGADLCEPSEIASAARKLVEAGKAEYVAVTLGREGALLIGADGACSLPAVPVETRSAVGAGDSFLAGMTYGLVRGLTPKDAFRIGSAAGAAAALTPGTDLCHPADVERLLEQVPQPSAIT